MRICALTGGRGCKPGSLLLVGVALCLVATGCTSFFAGQAMKNFQVEIKPVEGLELNRFQEDFLYLKALGEEVVPLADRYFPPVERAAMEEEILRELSGPEANNEKFLLGVRQYLAGFRNQHARIAHNPKPIQFQGVYPFRVRYVSNELYMANVSRDYDESLIGQRITGINDQPIAAVEGRMARFVSAENPWTTRKALESFPLPFSLPGYYALTGLAASPSNSIKLEFAEREPVSIAPLWQGPLEWHEPPPPAHPITARSEHPYDCQIFSEENLAYFQFNACFDKTAILDGLNYVKPWLRPAVRVWLGWQFQRKKRSPLLKGIYDPDRPVLNHYLAATIGEMNRQGITNLVLDLRHNGGGETSLCKQLLYFLTSREDLRDAREYHYNLSVLDHYHPKEAKEFRAWYREKFGVEPPSRQMLPAKTSERSFFASVTNPESPYYISSERPVFSGRIVVLVNEKTGSAAALLAALIQDNGLAAIVGTTTANNPTGPTGFTPFALPKSKVMISLPTTYLERARPSNGEILQPDHWVESTVSEIRSGRDAAFEKALELLSSDSLRRGGGADSVAGR